MVSTELQSTGTALQPVCLQDVVALLVAAGCPDLPAGGTLPRRRGSGSQHGRSKDIASSVL